VLCSELHSHIFTEGVSAGMGNKKNTQLNRRGVSAAHEWQPFLWAVKENRMDIAECLLDEFGCDLNEQQPITTSSNQSSALHLAANRGLEGMVSWLLQRGARKDLRDKHNNTALRLAESKNNPAIIQLLGGDPFARFVSSNLLPGPGPPGTAVRSAPSAAAAAPGAARPVSPPTMRPELWPASPPLTPPLTPHTERRQPQRNAEHGAGAPTAARPVSPPTMRPAVV
jgi:hypothetical protein